jgi:hypothetical protein
MEGEKACPVEEQIPSFVVSRFARISWRSWEDYGDQDLSFT